MSDKKYIVEDEQAGTQLKKNKLGDLRSFVFLLKYTKGVRFSLALAFVLILLNSILSIMSAKYMGLFIEDGFMAKDIDKSIVLASTFIFLEIIAVFSLWIGGKLLAKASSLTILEIRSKIFDQLQKLPLKYYDKRPQGRIVTRITHDVEGIEEFFSGSLRRLVNACLMTVLAVSTMVVSNFKIGSIMVLSIIPAIIYIVVTKSLVRNVNRRISMCSSAINSKLSEFINGIEVIRFFGLEKWSQKEYDNTVNDHLESQLKANVVFAATRPWIGFLCSMPLLVLVWFGGKLVIEGAISIGVFITFMRYSERFVNPVITLSREFHVIQKAFTCAERIASFLSEENEDIELGEDGSFTGDCDKVERHRSIPSLSGNVKFENVFMKYDEGGWILDDLSFEINSGKKIGFVGTTGCGKSTTVSLLSRLYEFQKGQITIDGVDIRKFNRSFLRSSIGFVSQDVVIFKGSLRENLNSDNDILDVDIIKACKKTGFFKVMENSYLTLDSNILDGGANLSIGERQLLSLTRVLLRNPSILILDEATANIDPDYELIIKKAVDQIMDDRTCIIIAHRLDSLESCNEIFVFNKGKLVETGSNQELMKSKGHYYNLQKANEKSDAEELS